VTGQEWVFTALAVVGSVAAFRLVTTTNVVHGALFLVVALAAIGGAYLLLAAEFVAWVQVLIYVGAIVILFLFGLMLTRAPIGRDALDNQQRWLGALVALLVFAGLVFLIQDAYPIKGGQAVRALPTTTAQVGDSIFRNFVLPFEAISFLLLAALIGAVVLARKDQRP
jgi:NADH-quinone oxidoreductase subunit J